ncbi:hypothetical protein HU200_002798 [Digitaria exilis]|uniref:Uncharacterized protein n=1 Tax=Digitaria exilis TaxID=1010633 RepID=A0A835KV18_9POAL|nr:hypothetical protein HU200_002798 [Digitaria exilis]
MTIPQHINSSNFSSISDWCEATAKTVHASKRREPSGMAIYIMWNLSKERNRHIFESKLQSAQQVVEKTKEDLENFKRAFRTPRFSLGAVLREHKGGIPLSL